MNYFNTYKISCKGILNLNIQILILEVFMEKIQQIKCDVYDCRFCDTDTISCSLKKIKVSNCNHNNNKEATMCDSFKRRK